MSLGSQQTAPGERVVAEDLEAGFLSLRLVPEEISLWGHDASQQVLVLGKYSDGLERDLTGRSRFSIADPDLAVVNQQARVKALAEGETTIRG